MKLKSKRTKIFLALAGVLCIITCVCYKYILTYYSLAILSVCDVNIPNCLTEDIQRFTKYSKGKEKFIFFLYTHDHPMFSKVRLIEAIALFNSQESFQFLINELPNNNDPNLTCAITFSIIHDRYPYNVNDIDKYIADEKDNAKKCYYELILAAKFGKKEHQMECEKKTECYTSYFWK